MNEEHLTDAKMLMSTIEKTHLNNAEKIERRWEQMKEIDTKGRDKMTWQVTTTRRRMKRQANQWKKRREHHKRGKADNPWKKGIRRVRINERKGGWIEKGFDGLGENEKEGKGTKRGRSGKMKKQSNQWMKLNVPKSTGKWKGEINR